MIRSRVGICLDEKAEYLDLSKSGIVAVGNLNGCGYIQVLNLSQNCLQDVMNIGMYTNLWKLDLSYNQVKSLTGLVNFIVLGSLNLSHNQLTWSELLKLRHIQILDLTLHGNPHLVKDMYYQCHVIDCLPNCWMLDGKIITSADHLRVKQFFKETEKQKQPVRHKLPRYNFFPSFVKKVKDRGTFGPRAVHVLTTFPLNKSANIEIDKKRLKYLAFNMQEIVALENPKSTTSECLVKVLPQYLCIDAKRFSDLISIGRWYVCANVCNPLSEFIKNHSQFLQTLLNLRVQDTEQSNVLFLMLLASLEFCIPSQVIVEMLSVTKLHKCGDIITVDLFLLPRELRCITVGLLFNAIKLDRDENVHAGVYEQLFLHLSSNLPDLLKFTVSKTCKSSEQSKTQCYKDYRFLLAAEICQVLMLVPSFYHHLQLQDPGLLCVMIEATNHEDIPESIKKILGSQVIDQHKIRVEVSEEDHEEISTFALAAGSWQRELSEMLATMIQYHLREVTSKEPNINACEQILYLNPFKGKIFWKHGVIRQTGNKILDGELFPQSTESKHKPRINDTVILGKQVYGKIISLPTQYTAKVYIEGVFDPDGYVIKKVKQTWKNYKTINLKNMDWDSWGRCWRWKMPKDYRESLFMEAVSPLDIKSEDVKPTWNIPVRCMSAKATKSRSLSYVTRPDLKEKSFYVHCTDLNQEQQLKGQDSIITGSALNSDQPEVKVIMNMDNASDSMTKEELTMKKSDFENYVMGVKPPSAKREHPDSELLVIHLEPYKRPHSVIPSLSISNMGRKATQDYLKKKYPLLANKKNMFLKLLMESPLPTLSTSRSRSISAMSLERILSGGDACRRRESSDITATKSVDTIHGLQKEREEGGPKSNGISCPELKNHLQLTCGQNWLANGRNVFQEKRQQEVLLRSNALNGWKHGVNPAQRPVKSAINKSQCPLTAFRLTRPKSSINTLRMHEESFSRAETNEAVRIQEVIDNLLRDKKDMSKESSSPVEKPKEEENENENEDASLNLEVSSYTNVKTHHPPNTPVTSPYNFPQK